MTLTMIKAVRATSDEDGVVLQCELSVDCDTDEFLKLVDMIDGDIEVSKE